MSRSSRNIRSSRSSVNNVNNNSVNSMSIGTNNKDLLYHNDLLAHNDLLSHNDLLAQEEEEFPSLKTWEQRNKYQPEDEKRWSRKPPTLKPETVVDWSDPLVKKKAILASVYTSVAVVIILVIVLVLVFVVFKKRPGDITQLSLYDGGSKAPVVVTHPKDKITVLMSTKDHQYQALKDYSWSLNISGTDTPLEAPTYLNNGVSFILPQAFTTTARITVKDLVHKYNQKTLTFTILPNFHFVSGPGSAPPTTIYKPKNTYPVQLRFNDTLIPSNTTWTLQISYDKQTWTNVLATQYTFSYTSQSLSWTLDTTYQVNIVYWRLLGTHPSFPLKLVAQAPFPFQVAGAPPVFVLISIEVETSDGQPTIGFIPNETADLVITYAGSLWPTDNVPTFTYTDGVTGGHLLTATQASPPAKGTAIYTIAIPQLNTNGFAVTITKGNQTVTSTPPQSVSPGFTFNNLSIPNLQPAYVIGGPSINLNLSWAGATSFPTNAITGWNYSLDKGVTWRALTVWPVQAPGSGLLTNGIQTTGVTSFTFPVPTTPASSYRLQVVGTGGSVETLDFMVVTAATFQILNLTLDKTYYLPTDTITATVKFLGLWPSTGVVWKEKGQSGALTVKETSSNNESPKTFTFPVSSLTGTLPFTFQLQITVSDVTYTSQISTAPEVASFVLQSLSVQDLSFSPGATIIMFLDFQSTDPNGWTDFNGAGLTQFSYLLNGGTTATTFTPFIVLNTLYEGQVIFSWVLPTSFTLGATVIIQASYQGQTAVQTTSQIVVVSFLSDLSTSYNLLSGADSITKYVGPATAYYTTITGVTPGIDLTTTSFTWALGYINASGVAKSANIVYIANDPVKDNTKIICWYVADPTGQITGTPKYTPYISYSYNQQPLVFTAYSPATYTVVAEADLFSQVKLTGVQATDGSGFAFGTVETNNLNLISVSAPGNGVAPLTTFYWVPTGLNQGSFYQGMPPNVSAVGLYNAALTLSPTTQPVIWTLSSAQNQGQAAVFMKGSSGSNTGYIGVTSTWYVQTTGLPLYSTANLSYYGL